MRKIIIVVIGAVIVTAVGFGVYWQMQKKRITPTDVLPQGPLFYTEYSNVEKNLKQLSSMPIWIGIQNINYDLLGEKGVLTKQQASVITLIKRQLSDVLTNPVAKRLFGKDVAVAIYPPSDDMDVFVTELKILNPKVVEEWLAGFYLVTRVDPDVQFAEFFSRFFDQFGENITREETEYKGEIIHAIQPAAIGIKLGVVRIEDLIIIGIGEQSIRRSIDVYKNDELPLKTDQEFTKLQKVFLAPPAMKGFINIGQIYHFLQSQADHIPNIDKIGSNNQSNREIWQHRLARFAGLKMMGFSSQLNPVARFDYNLMFDPVQLDRDLAPIYTCPAQRNETVAFTPQDVLGYQWSNCVQFDHYWDQIEQEVNSKAEGQSQIDSVEEQTGFNIKRDILPAFGDEVGGYVQDIQEGGFFPVPKMLVFVEIKDRSKADGLIAKASEQPFIVFQKENYKGVDLHYLSVPLGKDIQPGYAFLGDYLLVSTSAQLLKSSVDASENPALALKENPVFKAVDFGLTDKNRNVQFIRVGALVDKVKDVMQWGNQWMAAQDLKAQAFKKGSNQPLEEVKASLASKEKELAEMKTRIVEMEDKIWNMGTKGEDVTAPKEELNKLKEQSNAKELDISSDQERKAELENIMQEYENKAPDTSLRQVYLDEIINPVLDSLKSVRAFGLRATVDKNMFKTSIFFDMTK